MRERITRKPLFAARSAVLRLAALATALLLATALVPDAAAQQHPVWKAGVARAIITPEQPMAMAGYGGRDQPAEGKLTELWAKALALENAEGQRALLLTLDLVGIDAETTNRICSQLAEKAGLERPQIAICTSHTHCGPVVGRNLGPMHYWMLDDTQRRLIDAYAERLVSQVVEISLKAIDDLQPAIL